MATLKEKNKDYLKDSTFGLPEERKYPMPDKSHAANAKARASQQLHEGNLSKTDKEKIDRKAAAKSRDDARALKKAAADAELRSARLAEQCKALDRALSNADDCDPSLASLPVSELSRRRAQVAAELALAEEHCLEASEQLDQRAA